MPRPTKWRKVEFTPKNDYFLPLGKRKCELEEITLKVEEVEAMRLKDISGLNQEECAKKMQVSRQTFQNIILAARKKVATALVEGQAIKIGGGKYTRNLCSYKCQACGSLCNIRIEDEKIECSNCGSTNVSCYKKPQGCQNGCKRNPEKIKK